MGNSKNKTSTPNAKTNSNQFSSGSSSDSKKEGNEVLFNLPGGLKYRIPGQKQRIVLSSLLVGLNLILIICVILYQYVPSFKDFIFNIGR